MGIFNFTVVGKSGRKKSTFITLKLFTVLHLYDLSFVYVYCMLVIHRFNGIVNSVSSNSVVVNAQFSILQTQINFSRRKYQHNNKVKVKYILLCMIVTRMTHSPFNSNISGVPTLMSYISTHLEIL